MVNLAGCRQKACTRNKVGLKNPITVSDMGSKSDSSIFGDGAGHGRRVASRCREMARCRFPLRSLIHSPPYSDSTTPLADLLISQLPGEFRTERAN